jgi:hypothetical protein
MSLIRDILDLAIDIESDDYDISDGKISFYLNGNEILDCLANHVRCKFGYAPLDYCVERSNWVNSVEGWFNWYVAVGNFDVSDPAKSGIEIGFSVISDFADDDGEWYDIDLDEDDKAKLYYILLNQCEKKYNKNFVEMFSEVSE